MRKIENALSLTMTAKRDEYMRGIDAGLTLDFDKLTFGGVFKKWFYEVKKPAISGSSFERYESDYNLRIKDAALSSKVLVNITPLEMQSFHNSLLKKHSYKTVLATNKVLNMFFEYC